MDTGRAKDLMAVGAGVPLVSSANGTTLWRVDRWDEDQTAWAARRCQGQPEAADFKVLNVRPYETTEFAGNKVTNAGWTRLMNLLIGTAATQALDATHTRIGVGSGTTPVADYPDTDLVGPSKWFQPVSGAGTLGTRTLSFSASVGGSDGNFAWNEFGIDITSSTAAGSATVGAVLFNHVTSIAQGTKATGQTWTATATLTFS